MRNHSKEKALLEDKAYMCSGAASELSRGTIIPVLQKQAPKAKG